MTLDDCYNIADLRQAAKRRAHRLVFDYIDGAADDEVALSRSMSDFQDYDLVHRTLVGVDKVDTAISFLGQTLDVPFFCGPSAGNRLFHHDGETGVAKAAQAHGTMASLSTLASTSIEDYARVMSGPKNFQLYVWKDKSLVKDMLRRAKAAGFDMMTVTVDLPVHGNRERDPRNGFAVPPKIGLKQVIEAVKSPFWSWDYVTKPPVQYANLEGGTVSQSLVDFIAQMLDPSFTWEDVKAYRAMWDGPAMMKGIVHPDDARMAVEMGYDCVVVSNHGGRQLDGDISPIRALPSIVDAVGAFVPVVLDGGIRRGTDILKALALGATAVSFARPYLYGLAAGGQAGALKALSLLRAELERDMALLGVRKISDLCMDHVRLRSEHLKKDTEFGTFPR